jgi:Zinc carboxypeptidase
MKTEATPKVILITLMIIAGGWFSTVPSNAQVVPDSDRFSFSPAGEVDSSIPSPASFLGYEPGSQFTNYALLVRYLYALSEASDRVELHEYARTYENRPLHYLVITSKSNHERLEEIRLANLRLVSRDTPVEDAEALIAGQPVITWLSYNVHGNEPSSSEAAMQVAWRLAASLDDETDQLLENSVIIIDPAINPDGRDRYVNWYRSARSAILNRNSVDYEHDEPWPQGRTNHYWFDLNRDWVWLVHPESRGRIAAYRTWMPQVHMDYHEQGFNNNYFTMPGQSPRNLNLPDAYDDWADTFGRANAAAFDEKQVNYFTRESFDFFYPGYGSSYPSNMGAIGMLSEQGGHSRGARAVTTNDGYVLTLRQRIFDHFTTSMAVIRTAVANREGLLEYFRSFFGPETDKSETRAYLLPDDGGNGYTYDVIDILLRHGVRIDRASEEFEVRDASSYRDGDVHRRRFKPGTFVIRTDQEEHVFINTLMQRQMEIEDSVMYDMATWSIPLAYNLDAAWTNSALAVESEPVLDTPAYDFGVENREAQYAYAIDWSQRNAPRALSLLWEEGYRVRSARKTFSLGAREFSRGSLVILIGRNLDRTPHIAIDMDRIAEAARVRIVGFDSGRVDEGTDLASASNRPVERPRTGLVVDDPTSSYTAGQLWFLFDQWTGFGIDRIRARRIASMSLKEYRVLVLPGGRYSSVFDSTTVEKLRSWVSAGGTLVATESAATFLTGDRSGLTGVKLTGGKKDKGAAGDRKKAEKTGMDRVRTDTPGYTTYEARRDSSGLKRIPGSALRGIVDISNPLAFGVKSEVYSLKFNSDALEPSESLQTVGYYDPDPKTILASGYASQINRRKLAGKTFAAVQNIGSGRVVFLVDNTQYRLFWVGTARMVQNAVMLLPGM